MKKRIFVLALGCAAALLLSACGSALSGTLRVGVKTDVANFGLLDEESGQFSGMEIDLAELLRRELGYRNLELVAVTSSNREEKLVDGEIDMMIATVTMTEERRAAYSFSAPYYTDHVKIMVEKSSLIDEIGDLRGCTVGVMQETNHALTLARYLAARRVIPDFDEAAFVPTAFQGGVTFREYGSYLSASRALESGEVDAFIADGSILSGFSDEGRVLLPDQLSVQEYGVGMLKDSGLAARVDRAIDGWLEDGTIAALCEKWGI